MATYWQAEIFRGDSCEADFPSRTTLAEALDDARSSVSSLTERERNQVTEAGAAEWRVVSVDDEGTPSEVVSTGRWQALSE